MLVSEMDKQYFESIALHATYGQAVLAAHALERTLISVILINTIDLKNIEKICAGKEIKRLKKLTLRNLIREVTQCIELSEYWREELDNMLFFRNLIVHEISDLIINGLLDKKSKYEISEKITEIKSYFTETNEYFSNLIYMWLEENGFNKELVIQTIKKVISPANNQTENASVQK